MPRKFLSDLTREQQAMVLTAVDQWPRPEPRYFFESVGIASEEAILDFVRWLRFPTGAFNGDPHPVFQKLWIDTQYTFDFLSWARAAFPNESIVTLNRIMGRSFGQNLDKYDLSIPG